MIVPTIKMTSPISTPHLLPKRSAAYDARRACELRKWIGGHVALTKEDGANTANVLNGGEKAEP